MTANSDASPHVSGESPTSEVASRRLAPVWWLALMASPVAAANNATVLIIDDIGSALGTSSATASWLATAFALALAIATPLQAALMRHRGERAVLWSSASLVAAGTIIVILSPWLPLTVGGRATQAAGGAGLFVLALALAGNARRIGAISAGMGVLGAIGPLIGVQLTDAVSWRVAPALLVITLIAVPIVNRYAAGGRASAERFDAWGALLVVVLSGGIVLLAGGSLYALAATAIAIVLLVFHVRRRPDGYVPVAAVRSMSFLSATGLTFALSVGYFTLLFVIPPFVTIRADWTKDAVASWQLAAMVLGSFATLGFTSIAKRFPRATIRVVLAGAGFVAVLTAIYASSPILLLVGMGLALFSATSANATQVPEAVAALAERQRPTAIGLFTLTYLLGGAIGPALAFALFIS